MPDGLQVTVWTIDDARCTQYLLLDGKEWAVETRWAEVAGRMEVIDMRVMSVGEPPEPITVAALRRLQLGRLQEQARAAVPTNRVPLDYASAFAETGPHRGVALGDDELAAVAEVYKMAWHSGVSVARTVADKFNISRSTASKRIMAARAVGLLDGIGRGQRER